MKHDMSRTAAAKKAAAVVISIAPQLCWYQILPQDKAVS